MGEVLAFRAKRLSGFIPDHNPIDQTDTLLPGNPNVRRNLAEPIIDDRACSETNPDSGDCT